MSPLLMDGQTRYELLLRQLPHFEPYGGIRYQNYPLVRIVRGCGPAVLLTGGVHGDEPGAVEGLLHFLTEDLVRWSSLFTLHCYPCINPGGYDCQTRVTADGIDPNRLEPESPERTLFHQSLGSYAVAIDCHEDGDTGIFVQGVSNVGTRPRGFYLWELCHDRSARVGPAIIRAMRANNIRVHDGADVYGELCTDGVIFYPEGCTNAEYAKGTSIDAYLWGRHTPQALTLETELDMDIDVRAEAHRLAINTALEQIAMRHYGGKISFTG